MSVDRQLVGLDERLRSLSAERDKLTGELQELVAQLVPPQAASAAGPGAPPESLAKLTGQ